MKYKKTITLKCGRECTIENCTEDKAKEVLSLFIKTHAESDFMLSYPDEISFTEADEAEYLKEKTESENEIEIMALLGDKVVGTAGIDSIGKAEKTKHRAEFGIAVLKDYWGLGIGRALTSAIIEIAKQAGYSQLELNVVAENTAAIRLYQSAGFKEYGRNPKGFRSRLSGYQELILMRLDLD